MFGDVAPLAQSWEISMRLFRLHLSAYLTSSLLELWYLVLEELCLFSVFDWLVFLPLCFLLWNFQLSEGQIYLLSQSCYLSYRLFQLLLCPFQLDCDRPGLVCFSCSFQLHANDLYFLLQSGNVFELLVVSLRQSCYFVLFLSDDFLELMELLTCPLVVGLAD